MNPISPKKRRASQCRNRNWLATAAKQLTMNTGQPIATVNHSLKLTSDAIQGLAPILAATVSPLPKALMIKPKIKAIQRSFNVFLISTIS